MGGEAGDAAFEIGATGFELVIHLLVEVVLLPDGLAERLQSSDKRGKKGQEISGRLVSNLVRGWGSHTNRLDEGFCG